MDCLSVLHSVFQGKNIPKYSNSRVNLNILVVTTYFTNLTAESQAPYFFCKINNVQAQNVAIVEPNILYFEPQQYEKISTVHSNENPISVFLFWELRGLSSNFHIHMSVSDLYIPRNGPHIFLQQNKQIHRGNI
jgi:hypothetical protein